MRSRRKGVDIHDLASPLLDGDGGLTLLRKRIALMPIDEVITRIVRLWRRIALMNVLQLRILWIDDEWESNWFAAKESAL